MQFFGSECLTLSGLFGFRHARFHYVNAGQIIVVVPKTSAPVQPIFDELGSGLLESSAHSHHRALLMMQQLVCKRDNKISDTLVFLICGKCFVGSRPGREIVRRPIAWQYVEGSNASPSRLRPLRLSTTTEIQRGFVVSAWEVAEELIERCLNSSANGPEFISNPLLLNPFSVDFDLLRSLRTEQERSLAAGALVNFLWEVWSVTNSSNRKRFVSSKLTTPLYLSALWNDLSLLCDMHFIALDRIRPQSSPSTVQPSAQPSAAAEEKQPSAV